MNLPLTVELSSYFSVLIPLPFSFSIFLSFFLSFFLFVRKNEIGEEEEEKKIEN
jgi:hypothetical protein